MDVPRDLVEALHGGCDEARDQLWEWLREPLGKLLEGAAGEYGVTGPWPRVTAQLWHAAETHLRARRPDEFEGQARNVFVAGLLFYLAKRLLDPERGPAAQLATPAPLPAVSGYLVRQVALPLDRARQRVAGGDWLGGVRGGDGSLWLFLADVTGTGCRDRLFAAHLEHLWRLCWQQKAMQPRDPTDLLRRLHGFLNGLLPEGVYVEGVVLCGRSEGTIRAAPAGRCRLLIRRAGDRDAELHTLIGGWPGVSPPEEKDAQTWYLRIGDEMVLASDGLFRQVPESERSAAPLTAPFRRGGASASLLDATRQVLHDALSGRPQHDDITLVSLGRRAEG